MNNQFKTYFKYSLLTTIALLFFLPVGIANSVRLGADKIGDTNTDVP